MSEKRKMKKYVYIYIEASPSTQIITAGCQTGVDLSARKFQFL